jgi:4-hydroxy 2-oxovalerate aldolase
VLQLLRDEIAPLRDKFDWGALIPYNITGQMSLHPRAAIKFMDSDEKGDYVKFYDEIIRDS